MNKNIENKKRFAGEKKSSMSRRSDNHDYKSRCFYLITLIVKNRKPLLGTLKGKINSNNAPYVELSPLGQKVQEEWYNISSYYPELTVVAVQLMPDHLHGIIFVKDSVDFHIGQVIKGFKIGCNRILREICYSQSHSQLSSYAAIQSQPTNKATLWMPGYNDKILHNYSTLSKWKQYLVENPLRLAVRRTHPEFFRVSFGITVNNVEFSAIGNKFLLTNPNKVQVKVSRDISDDEVNDRINYFMNLARQGAVLVSPSISPGEKIVMETAISSGLPVILIAAKGFNSYSKPGHRYFAACAQGKLLMLAPWPHHNERIKLTRDMCLKLNEITHDLCYE